MEPDNFDLHVYSNNVRYYHKDLMNLIGSIKEKDKSELEKFANEVSEKLGKQAKLVWGYHLGNRYINDVLGHISVERLRMAFDLDPIDLDRGCLKYSEHNIGTHDNIKAALYSILLRYISILNKRAIKKL